MKAGRTVDQAVAEMKLPAKYSSYDMANARNDVQRVHGGRSPREPESSRPSASVC